MDEISGTRTRKRGEGCVRQVHPRAFGGAEGAETIYPIALLNSIDVGHCLKFDHSTIVGDR